MRPDSPSVNFCGALMCFDHGTQGAVAKTIGLVCTLLQVTAGFFSQPIYKGGDVEQSLRVQKEILTTCTDFLSLILIQTVETHNIIRSMRCKKWNICLIKIFILLRSTVDAFFQSVQIFRVKRGEGTMEINFVFPFNSPFCCTSEWSNVMEG